MTTDGSDLPIIDGEVLGDTEPEPEGHADIKLFCERDGIYVGIPDGTDPSNPNQPPVLALPEEVATRGAWRDHSQDLGWLAGHCWGCGRAALDIALAQGGQGLGQ